MIAVGDTLPQATLMESTEFGEACPLAPKPVDTVAASKGKRVVIFGVPGAFTPTCSAQHMPSYLKHLDALRGKGVDEVWCMATNDGFVMAAWGQSEGATGKIRMLGDGSGDFTRKLGLELDLGARGMGIRCQRFSMFVDDGVVKQLNVEVGGKFAVSGADTLLGQLA